MADGSHGGTVRAILCDSLANGGIAIATSVVASITGSGRMLAEASHACADTGNLALLFLDLRQCPRSTGALSSPS